MASSQEADALRWVERFTRALECVRIDSGPGEFIGDLVDAALQVSRADRGYGILMDGDVVIAEAAYTSTGDTWPADDPTRKRGARSTLGAMRVARDPGGRIHGFELSEREAVIPFRVRGSTGGSLLLLGIDSTPDGRRDLGLTAALAQALARTYAATLAEQEAVERAERAEARVKEIERATATGGVGAVAYLKPVAELERDAIELALRTTRWNKEKAARRLGISRASIYMKVKKYGLQQPPNDLK